MSAPLTPERRAELRPYVERLAEIWERDELTYADFADTLTPADFLALLDAADERDRLAARLEGKAP